MKPLTPSERRALRAQAHHLDPVVIVGQHGVTPAVLREIDLALRAHELVKVRVASDDRSVREAALADVAAKLDCAPVQHLGKVLVLWRPDPDRKPPPSPAPAPGKARDKRPAGPRAPVDPVRARRRARTEAPHPPSGKGRRGAARNAPVATEPAASGAAPAVRRKSTFTPKTTPKSFSAKPNPRSAWQKPAPAAAKARKGAAAAGGGKRAAAGGPPAAGARKPAAGARRRRTGG